MLGLLCLASLAAMILKFTLDPEKHRQLIGNLISRINAWWVMVITFFIAILAGRTGAIVLFAFISFLALREFLTLTPTRRGDHRSLFWVFFVITPLQYYLLA